jgi:hypothetical protein
MILQQNIAHSFPITNRARPARRHRGRSALHSLARSAKIPAKLLVLMATAFMDMVAC